MTYDLLPGQGEPMPIEVRVPRMGAGMRPTRGRRVYEMDRPGLKDLAGEVRLLPEDKVAMSLIAAHEAPTGGAAAPWDPTILDRILRVLAHTREVRVHGEPVRVVTEPVELGLVVADHGDGVRMWAERRRGPDEPAPEGERLPPDSQFWHFRTWPFARFYC